MPLWLGLLAVGAVLRLVYCFLPPLYTTDLLRNVGYGMAFPTWGFTLYEITPFDLSPWPCQFLWSNRNFPYPAVTLLFFAGVTLIHHALVWGKLVLTLIDGINAFLIYRISRDRILVLLYWFNPIHIWFASREGQFEPMVILWMLLALRCLQLRKPWAYFFLGLSIQAKIFPVFLVPYFLKHMSWHTMKANLQEWGWGIASLIPSVWAALTSSYLKQFISPGYIPAYNPLSWNVLDQSLRPFFPYPLIWAHWIVGIVFLLGCVYVIKQTGRWIDSFAPFVFVLFVKANKIGQFWYMMLTPAFCLTVEDARYRRLLFLLAFFLGIRSLYSILIGPIGYQNPADAQYLIELSLWGF